MRSARLINLFLTCAVLTGCGTANYYRAVSTTAVAVSSGYRALDQADDAHGRAIAAKIEANKTEAQKDLNNWDAVYRKAHLALDVAEDVVEKCMPAPNIPGCIASLLAAGGDVAKALDQAGVKP